MDIKLVGEQITKFRKVLNMTQEELGRAVGVSTQAVSRWENGGAPDVSLLPAIADKLGVTIDALFGREEGEVRDMTGTLAAWLRSKSEMGRTQALSRLIWEAMLQGGLGVDVPEIGYPKSSEQEYQGEKRWMQLLVPDEDGFVLGVGGEDMSFMCVLPEPEAGYERYLLDNEQYREVFATLAIPGSLELIRYFCREKASFYAVPTVAKRVGLETEEAEKILDALANFKILKRIELEMEDGPIPAYIIGESVAIIPLLYFVRWISQQGLYISYDGRQRPILQPKEKNHEKN